MYVNCFGLYFAMRVIIFVLRVHFKDKLRYVEMTIIGIGQQKQKIVNRKLALNRKKPTSKT